MSVCLCGFIFQNTALFVSINGVFSMLGSDGGGGGEKVGKG